MIYRSYVYSRSLVKTHIKDIAIEHEPFENNQVIDNSFQKHLKALENDLQFIDLITVQLNQQKEELIKKITKITGNYNVIYFVN